MSAPDSALSRRRVLQGFAAVVRLWQFGGSEAVRHALASRSLVQTGLDPVTTQTLEAFADTVMPGVKRAFGDVAVAGAAPGPSGATVAFEVLTMPEVALTPQLPGMAQFLNSQATEHAATHGLPPSSELSAFAGLPYEHRVGLVAHLAETETEALRMVLLLTTLVSWAFDMGAGVHTAQAVPSHPGLTWLQFPSPDADGLWRFPQFSYRRALAAPSPHTTVSGSPA